MSEDQSRARVTAESAGAVEGSRVPLPARATVGLVAGVTGGIAWLTAGLFWDLLRGTPVLGVLTPRGFTGFVDLTVRADIWPWLGLLALVVVTALVVTVAVGRRGQRGNRAAYFFTGWFAAVLGGSVAAAVTLIRVLINVTVTTDQATQLVVQNVTAAAYWGLTAGWLVGFVTVVAAGLIPAPPGAPETVRVRTEPNPRGAAAAPNGRGAQTAPSIRAPGASTNGWTPSGTA